MRHAADAGRRSSWPGVLAGITMAVNIHDQKNELVLTGQQECAVRI